MKKWSRILLPAAALLMLAVFLFENGSAGNHRSTSSTVGTTPSEGENDNSNDTEEETGSGNEGTGDNGCEDENLSESQAWENNVLMSDFCEITDEDIVGETYVFTTPIMRKEIISVTFLDTLQDAPSDAWDFSEAQDGSVLGWAEESSGGYDLYIAGEGGVAAPSNCARMFRGYENAAYIDFNGAFHTDNVVSMLTMFGYCSALTELDLSGFNTGKVESMEGMFWKCSGLVNVDLTGFDTSKVTSMYAMFYECSSLTSLDLNEFNTGMVEDMSYMFCNCSGLRELNVISFSTSSVTDMSYMFYCCSGLTELNLTSFDTSSVTDMSYMLHGCSDKMNLYYFPALFDYF